MPRRPRLTARQVATVVEVAARVAEIMRVGAERAEVTAEEVIRELKKLGVRKHDAGFNRM